jgi:hypothetical protein
LTSFQPEKPEKKGQKNQKIENFLLPVSTLPEVPDEASCEVTHH